MKRLDPNLLFYYYSSAHDRFREGPLPGFDEPSHKERVPPRVPIREQLYSNTGRRSTLIVKGQGSIRSQFHNVPVEIPLPPSTNIICDEHSY